MAFLTEAGLIGSSTVIVTTVHPLQILDEDLSETAHDFSVDLIITTDEIIHCQPPRRPTGIVRAHLTTEKLQAIPTLSRFAT